MIDTSTLSILFLLVIHTGALFYWGGRVSKTLSILEVLVKDHDARIRALELR